MHASIEHLIQLRDQQPVAVDMANHVAACAHCQARLNTLVERRAALRALPQLQPSANSYKNIRSHLAASDRTHPRLVLAAAAVMAAVLIAAWVGLSLRLNDLDRSAQQSASAITNGVAPTGAASSQTRQLMRQSQSLEAMIAQLQQLPVNSLSAPTEQALFALQNRLAVLDYSLNHRQVEAIEQNQIEQLWQRRVSTLQNIIDIQYAELAVQGYHGFQVIPANSLENERTW